MTSPDDDFRLLESKRLLLRAIDPLDAPTVATVLAIECDPRTWQHLPAMCDADLPAKRAAWMGQQADSWARQGLGWWVIRLTQPVGGLQAGTIVGTGGCGCRDAKTKAWNLGYRLTPAVWGNGLAGEVAQVAIVAAKQTRPDFPVVARVLTHNSASWHVLERVGMQLVWEGDAAADDPLTTGMPRRIYADRSLSPVLLAQLIALG
ncbi:MAG: GNAT family N-acetyltransferase [Propionibacteriaceae bacterium]|nr:GNAT family N-acetyltransferase [Propionibacteriaceae bacterium]